MDCLKLFLRDPYGRKVNKMKPFSNNQKTDSVRPLMRWWESLHFKFSLIQCILLVFIVGTTIFIIMNVERSLLLEKGYDLAEELGGRMVSELEERVTLAESLTTSLANLGEILNKDVEQFMTMVPHLLDYEGEEAFIAGGGIWPEPNAFTPGVVRRSFFWGRDKKGLLKFYDGYNESAGAGYHNEEWYVPATFIAPGMGFWSKSYMDPYSYQSMVTCTVPMYVSGKVTGVATVDLKLEGLDAFFNKAAESIGGYIFAVDRNNKFLSFPKSEMSKFYKKDVKGNLVQEYKYVFDLVEKIPSYQAIADELVKINEDCINRARSNSQYTPNLIERIHNRSYQINPDEARLIAAVVVKSRESEKSPIGVRRLFLDSDPLLNEPVMASIFHVPRTYWKVVVVSSTSKFYSAADAATLKVASYVIFLELTALTILYFVLRGLFIKPIRKMAKDVKQIVHKAGTPGERLNEIPRHELGELAFEFNRRTDRMICAIERSNKAKIKLEENMAELQRYANTQTVLLSDVNHRVKNNLSTIISILHMEEERFKAEDMTSYLPILSDLENRIQGLSTVHSMLSESEWRPLVLSRLCEKIIRRALQGLPPSKSVELNISPSPVLVNSNQAHQLAIVINELVSNSMKYALQEHDNGQIIVKIKQDGRNVSIHFIDCEPGYPDGLVKGCHDKSSIGFELIHGIVTQSLNGEVSFDYDNGAVTKILFENELKLQQSGGNVK